jgi:hypothetical protein
MLADVCVCGVGDGTGRDTVDREELDNIFSISTEDISFMASNMARVCTTRRIQSQHENEREKKIHSHWRRGLCAIGSPPGRRGNAFTDRKS